MSMSSSPAFVLVVFSSAGRLCDTDSISWGTLTVFSVCGSFGSCGRFTVVVYYIVDWVFPAIVSSTEGLGPKLRGSTCWVGVSILSTGPVIGRPSDVTGVLEERRLSVVE